MLALRENTLVFSRTESLPQNGMRTGGFVSLVIRYA